MVFNFRLNYNELMKKLLTLLFLFAILYSPYSHSNIFSNILGKVSTNDVKLYDKSYTSGLYDVFGKPLPTKIRFEAKIQNLNPKTSIKEVYVKIEVFDCKKGCKDCITADIGVYEVLKNEFYGYGENTILRPYNIFQVDMRIDNETKKSTYVQASGNQTCFTSSIDKVKGLNILD